MVDPVRLFIRRRNVDLNWFAFSQAPEEVKGDQPE
jgi:hypothetical protein